MAQSFTLLKTKLISISVVIVVLSVPLLAQRSVLEPAVKPTPKPGPKATPVPTPFRAPVAPIKSQQKTDTLSPTAFITYTQQSIKKGAEFFITGDRYVAPPPANSLYVGYLHDTNGKDDQGSGYEARNEFYRSGLRFEVPHVISRPILNATLNLRIYKTHVRGTHSNPDYNNATKSCAIKAASAKSRWYSSGSFNDFGDPFVAILPSGTQDMHIDITPLARSWATHPETNFGLIMLGENEDLKAYTETICQTQFVHAGDGAPTLTITY